MSAEPNCTTPEGGSTFSKSPCDGFAWDALVRRFENDRESVAFGDWIDAELCQMETALAVFVTPGSMSKRTPR